MSEHSKSKSDLNPGESSGKPMESPRKSKRLSLAAAESCLPKITESGENLIEPAYDKVSAADIGRAYNNGVTLHRDKDKLETTEERPSIDIHKDEEESVDQDREVMITTDLDSIKRVRNKSFDSDEGVNGEENANVKVCHKKVKHAQKVDLEVVRTNTGHTLTPKQSAIDKLVKAKSKDILSIIEKIKCVQKLDEPIETKPKCPHCKPWSPGDGRKSEKCLVCDITNAAEKLTSIDTNRFLVEILYPHDFYDKYSRSRRKIMHIDSNESPAQVPLIKPVKVVRKHVSRPVVLKMNSNNENGKTDVQEGTFIGDAGKDKLGDNVVKPRDDTPPRSRLFGLTEHEKSTIHTKCGEGTQAVFIVDGTNYEKSPLKGLKGNVRKDHVCREKLDRQVSQSMYEVNSLGMQFALPEYNGSLHHRKPGASQHFNFLSSSAHNSLTPRLFPTPEDGNQRITPFSRTIRLQRGLTFAGFDNSVKTHTSPYTAYQREITRMEPKMNPVEVPFKFGRNVVPSPNKSTNCKSSLPPIETKENTPNVFLTQGSTL